MLKNIAVIVMFINHFFAVYFTKFNGTNDTLENFQWYFTRISFFLFCFLLSEGMRYTRSRKKYILRLLIFALVSEAAYDFVLNQQTNIFYEQNAMFDLFAGALVIYFYDEYKNNRIIQIITIIMIVILDCLMRFSYSVLGSLLPLMFYICNNDSRKLLIYGIPISIILSILLYIVTYLTIPGYSLLLQKQYFYHSVIECGLLEAHGLLSLPLIFLYNKSKGKQLPRYFYYVFYPVHLLLIEFIVYYLIKTPIF